MALEKFNNGDLGPEVRAKLNEIVGSTGNRLMVAGNRFQFPRRVSNQGVGFNLASDRWHLSPNTNLMNLRAIYYAGYQHATNGMVGAGNAITFSSTIGFSGVVPGANQAFKKDRSAQVSVADGAFLVTDPSGILLPPRRPFRVRSWAQPANGYVPYGIPCLGQSAGSLSGFESGATDRSSYLSAQADLTQSATNAWGNATSDTAYEPIIVGLAQDYIETFAMFGDSLSYGALEVGVGGSATAAGAGDPYGNVGPFARRAHDLGYEYLNLGISGSVLNTWATNGYSDFAFAISEMCCSSAHIWLGTNDALSYSSSVILANIQSMVNRARGSFARRVLVGTLPPRTSGTFTSAAGQTPDATRTPVINAVNAALRAGSVTGCTIIDYNALMRDPSNHDVWRSDGGVQWTDDGTHYSLVASPLIAALIPAF